MLALKDVLLLICSSWCIHRTVPCDTRTSSFPFAPVSTFFFFILRFFLHTFCSFIHLLVFADLLCLCASSDVLAFYKWMFASSFLCVVFYFRHSPVQMRNEDNLNLSFVCLKLLKITHTSTISLSFFSCTSTQSQTHTHTHTHEHIQTEFKKRNAEFEFGFSQDRTTVVASEHH